VQTSPKVLFHNERGIELREDVTSNPKNPARSKPAREIKEEKMIIKGEEAATK